LVVAWTGQSFQGITVNGVQPRSHAQTAVAMSLPVDQLGAGPLPAGLVSAQLVDFEGDMTQQGPPGATLVQNGTVTYQFTPPLAAGLHLAGASLSASYPNFFKVPNAAPGAASSIRWEAWDWSRSAWVEIAYTENPATVLPAAVVNSASGEVRVRITVSNSQFSTFGLTLAGTVQ
jgi:hypothetical protein